MKQILVHDWMTPEVATVTPQTRLADARRAMSARHIRALPVISGDQLCGLLTHEAILRSDRSPLAGSEATQVREANPLHVSDVMAAGSPTIPSGSPVAVAARLMLENKLAALPVVDDTQALVGILTTSDLFRLILAQAPESKKDLRVRDYMTADVVTISPETSLREAHFELGARRIRALPVLSHGRLVGLVTHVDLLSADFSQPRTEAQKQMAWQILNAPVERIMTHPVQTIAPEAPLTEAARLMLENKFHCLPVLDEDRRLVGIITESDLFQWIVRNLM